MESDRHASESKIESTVRYLGSEVDDAIEIAEKTDISWLHFGNSDMVGEYTGRHRLRTSQ